ncbi:MAG: MraY family glycosyltransferase [Rectinemataceae bacterium]
MLGAVLLVSAALSSILIPLVIRFCHRYRLYDRLNERKIHKEERMPRLGGVGIALSFILTVSVIAILQRNEFANFRDHLAVWPIIGAATLVFLTGLLDDLFDLSAWIKFGLQSLAAVIVMAAGYRFRYMQIPFGTGLLDFGLVAYPLTFLWIVGVTNAINLIDGIDGLAGGVSGLSALSFALFFMFTSSVLPAEICLALLGSIIGFLLFNLPPARIFMGDCGSLFLGFMLAIIPLLSQVHTGSGNSIGVVSAATVLSIPIFDTLMAMYRRAKAKRSFFSSDRKHLHHVLLDRGYSIRSILAILYALTSVLGLVALSSLFLPLSWSFFLNLAMLGVMFGYFMRINAGAAV